MTQPQHRAWTMVASMFVTVAIVYGLSFDIIGLFYNSLAKEFALSRAKFSSLATSFSLSFLFGGLVAGWVLDRIGARFVVVGGAMVVIAGLLVATAASSFNAMLHSELHLPGKAKALGRGRRSVSSANLPLVTKISA